VLVAADKPVADWVKPASQPAGFVASGVARVPGGAASASDVTLAPFYKMSGKRYSMYFDVLAPADFAAREAAIAEEVERKRKMEAATIGFVQPGEMQPERDFNYQSDPANRQTQRIDGRGSRAGTGWFSFDLPVDPAAANAVVVTYENPIGDTPAGGNFRILVDGTEIGRFTANPAAKGFFDVTYAVPANLVQGKSKVTVRFEANGNSRIAPVFGVRTIRGGRPCP
jgi:hypothetical protein